MQQALCTERSMSHGCSLIGAGTRERGTELKEGPTKTSTQHGGCLYLPGFPIYTRQTLIQRVGLSLPLVSGHLPFGSCMIWLQATALGLGNGESDWEGPGKSSLG